MQTVLGADENQVNVHEWDVRELAQRQRDLARER
jgi:hypothetical protein